MRVKDPYANWKIRPETLKRVKRECIDRDVRQSELAELALQALRQVAPLSADATAEPSSESADQRRPQIVRSRYSDPKKRRMHELLDLIMGSATAHKIAIEDNLEMLAFAVVATRGRTTEELKGLLDSMLEAQRRQAEAEAEDNNHRYGT